ncbi:hypothetical protein SDC9_212133 [bioreactor metagenome]|uniref:Uncharacterized protein n=1 Tax=bioreactor metagenome TaxID=1076179 RepID=A0A645JL98_9ZZZZ
MDAACRPVAGHVAHRFHQAAWATAVHMPAIGLFQHGPQIERLVGIALVVVDFHVGLEFGRGKLFQIRGTFRKLAQIIELPRCGR